MNQFYNKEEFAALVLRAVGNTKKKEFASLIEVTPEYFSRIVNSKLANPPSVQKIQLIANHASNGVTYAQLLTAAGYASSMDDTVTLDAPDTLTETVKKFMQGTILTALSSLGVPFTMEQEKKDTNYHVSVSLSSGSVTKWHFIFLYNASMELMSSQLSLLYSRLIFENVTETEKISFVTSSKEEFDLYTKKKPSNLNLNLSVILIDEKSLTIQKESWLHSTSSISTEDISKYTL
ncbi:MAG: hypothetical protein IKK33_00025 [Lachnospiraceae bacterium]|nr:hypothetical protein [Lachnospiraceae bacterium]